MTKYYLSLFLILSFWAFAVTQKPTNTDMRQGSLLSSAGNNTQNTAPQTTVPSTPRETAFLPEPTPTPISIPSPVPTPTPVPIDKPKGQYRDGTFTGDAVLEDYGTIQVGAVITNGRLVDVQFLQYPTDRSTSREINEYALPILRTEAIQAQSANIDAVSGASFTSPAFIQSLDSALAMARN